MHNLLISVLVTWLLFVPIAFANGLIREKVYKPYVGNLAAHQISTLIAALAYIGLVYLMFHTKVAYLPNKQLLAIGLIWVAMTMIFEFGFGHYINGTPWEKLLLDYNIFKGHVWGVFLLVICFSPLIVKFLKFG